MNDLSGDDLDFDIPEIENNDNTNKVISDKSDISLTVNDKFDKKFKKDIDILLSMGYDIKMIRKIYMLLKPSDINDALDYLKKENGIYHHEFMEKYGQNDKCFICGEPPKNHINYDPKIHKTSTSIINSIRDSEGGSNNNNDAIKIKSKNDSLNEPLIDKNEEKKSNKKNKQILCNLCFEEMTEKESIDNKLPCKHLFCDDCYLNYLQVKIINNKVGKITCMQFQCTHEFDDEFIISHLKGDEKLINKYKRFLKKSELYKEKNVKFCPVKNCDSYARKEGENKYVTCQEGHKFCFECFKPWHGDKKCQDIIDKDFSLWGNKKNLKRCPKCKFYTEKNSGCNHMTCPECKYEWCWLCRRKCEKGHFKIGGPCYKLQFTQNKYFDICICLYGYKFLVWFLQSLMIIFYIPALMILFGLRLDLYFEKYSKIAYFLTIPLFILCYLTLFTGLGSIFFVVCSFVWCLKTIAITFLLDLGGY